MSPFDHMSKRAQDSGQHLLLIENSSNSWCLKLCRSKISHKIDILLILLKFPEFLAPASDLHLRTLSYSSAFQLLKSHCYIISVLTPLSPLVFGYCEYEEYPAQ